MDRKKWVKAWIDEEGGGCRGGGCARLMVPPLPNGRDRTQLLVYWLGGEEGFHQIALDLTLPSPTANYQPLH